MLIRLHAKPISASMSELGRDLQNELEFVNVAIMNDRTGPAFVVEERAIRYIPASFTSIAEQNRPHPYCDADTAPVQACCLLQGASKLFFPAFRMTSTTCSVDSFYWKIQAGNDSDSEILESPSSNESHDISAYFDH